MTSVLNLCSIKESFVVFRCIYKRGLSGWKLKNLNIFGEKILKNKTHVIYVHVKYVVCFFINPLMESKKAVVCSNVPWSPRLPEFSPDSRMLSLEARMLMLPCVCTSFKAKWILLKLQGKKSNLQKGILWKQKRLEIVNKIEVKRVSNATRELNVNTLRWSV